MKKYFLLLLITLFGFYLIGCSGKKDDPNDDDEDIIEVPEEEPEEEIPDDTEALDEMLKITIYANLPIMICKVSTSSWYFDKTIKSWCCRTKAS